MSYMPHIYDTSNELYHINQFSLVAESCPTLCISMDFSMPGFPVHHQLPEPTQIHVPHVGDAMEFFRPEYWNGQPSPSPGDLPNPGIKPRSPTLQADSLPSEPQGKPKNTGVGSLSLCQWIFPSQELNQGLVHCTQILQ